MYYPIHLLPHPLLAHLFPQSTHAPWQDGKLPHDYATSDAIKRLLAPAPTVQGIGHL